MLWALISKTYINQLVLTLKFEGFLLIHRKMAAFSIFS